MAKALLDGKEKLHDLVGEASGWLAEKLGGQSLAFIGGLWLAAGLAAAGLLVTLLAPRSTEQGLNVGLEPRDP